MGHNLVATSEISANDDWLMFSDMFRRRVGQGAEARQFVRGLGLVYAVFEPDKAPLMRKFLPLQSSVSKCAGVDPLPEALERSL
jgi:hypothetical protein